MGFYAEQISVSVKSAGPKELETQGGGEGHSIVKNMGGGWLDSLRSGISVGKRYFGVLQKY